MAPTGDERVNGRAQGSRPRRRAGQRRQPDAQRRFDEVTASVVTGQYVDPKAGTTFETVHAEWAARQVWEVVPGLAIDLAAVSAPFALPVAEQRRSHVEQWIQRTTTRGLTKDHPHPRRDVPEALRAAGEGR